MLISLLGYIALVVLAALVGAVAVVVLRRHRNVPGTTWLTVLMAAVTLWSSAKLLELAVDTGEVISVSLNLQYTGIVVIPVAWALFALEFTGREVPIQRRTIGAVCLVPTLVVVGVWTNSLHHQFHTSRALIEYGPTTLVSGTFGPLFWLHTAYSYALLALGTVLIVRFSLLAGDQYRKWTSGLLVAVCVPWVGNAITLSGIVPDGLDVTVVALAASGLLLTLVIVRHRLLDLVPMTRELAREEVIETMSDAVIVVNDRDRIVDCNAAAKSLLGAESAGAQLQAAAPSLATAIDDEPDSDGRTELGFRVDGQYRTYDVRTTVLDSRGIETGQVITLRDISEQRQSKQRLDVMQRLFRHNLRNEMNLVQGRLSLLSESLDDAGHRRTTDEIGTTVEKLVERSERLFNVVDRSEFYVNGPIDLDSELPDLVADIDEQYPTAKLSLDCPEAVWVDAGGAVLVAVEELLQNALSHNDTAEPSVGVSVTVECETVHLRIVDDGPGVPDSEIEPILDGRETQLSHGSGVGLWITTWIVRDEGGDLRFTGSEEGTTVRIELPRATAP